MIDMCANVGIWDLINSLIFLTHEGYGDKVNGLIILLLCLTTLNYLT